MKVPAKVKVILLKQAGQSLYKSSNKLFVKPALTIDEQICLLEKRGYAKGVLKTLIQLIRNGNLSLDRAAEIAAEDFLKKRGI